MKINFVIPCLLGLEKLIADELKMLEAENVIAENGRVLFSGDENLLARVNICSRYAERVQILVGSFEAFDAIDEFEPEDDYDVVRSKTILLKPESVEEAILQMNLLDHQFYMFKNSADDDKICVVYARKDGGYGLIIPEED